MSEQPVTISEHDELEIVASADDGPIDLGGLTLEAGTVLVKFLAMGPWAYILLPRIMQDHPYLIIKRNGEIVKLVTRSKNNLWTFVADPSSPNWSEMTKRISGPIKNLKNRVKAIAVTAGIIKGGADFICKRPYIGIIIMVIILMILCFCVHKSTLSGPVPANISPDEFFDIH